MITACFYRIRADSIKINASTPEAIYRCLVRARYLASFRNVYIAYVQLAKFARVPARCASHVAIHAQPARGCFVANREHIVRLGWRKLAAKHMIAKYARLHSRAQLINIAGRIHF
jgi:hypothetical protein